jgi:flagellar export protein FliJ
VNRKQLAAVLRIRELQERGARGELARARQNHQRAMATEMRTWTLIDEAGSGTPSGITAADLDGRQAIVAAGLLSVETQHLATERAGDVKELALEHWTAAARRVEALERLAERLAESEREEEQRLAANEIDDLVLARRGHSDPIGGVEP